MPAQRDGGHNRRTHPIIFLAALAIAGLVLSPFVTPITLALITAYILRPIVKRLETHTRSYSLALGIIVIAIAVPIIALLSYVSSNAVLFFSEIAGLGNTIRAIISYFSAAVAAMGLEAYADYLLGAQSITAKLTAYFVGVASDFVRNVPVYVLDFVIYLYAAHHFMKNGKKSVEFIRQYAKTLPKEDEHFLSNILEGLKRGFDVLFLSYITMSVIITITSYIIYAVFGVPHAFLLAILTGLFGFLPVLGVWMVYVPAAAYMYYLGNTFAAAGILASCAIVLSAIMPFALQPYLGAKKTGASEITILFGFFAGPIVLGAKGIILGPILLILAETIIVGYMKYRIEGMKK